MGIYRQIDGLKGLRSHFNICQCIRAEGLIWVTFLGTKKLKQRKKEHNVVGTQKNSQFGNRIQIRKF